MKSSNLKIIKRMCEYIHRTIEVMSETDEISLAIEVFDDVAYRLMANLDDDIEAAKREEEMQSEF